MTPRLASSDAPPVYKAALDSGATTTCFPSHYRGNNYQPVTQPSDSLLAQAANDEIIASVATDQLNEPNLPPIAKEAHLFHEISVPFLSVNNLCKGNLAVLFNGPKATVFKPDRSNLPIPGETVLEGHLDNQSELYMVDIHGTNPTHTKLQRGNTRKPKLHSTKSLTIRTVPALINFYHMTLGAPPISTWITGIDKGWFTSFPGLTSA